MKIHQSIPEILTFLFQRYGEIEDKSQFDKENEIRNISFHAVDPFVTIFSPLEDPRELEIYAQNPYSEAQLIHCVLEIIKRTNDFEPYLETWYALPSQRHTRTNFKLHFEEAQRKLKKYAGLP